VARTGVVLGAALVVVGGAALGYALTRPPEAAAPQGNPRIDAGILQLDNELHSARVAARERANTIARLPVVQQSVGTDKATVEDQRARGELDFKPEGGEVIELQQTVDGKPATLLVQPAGGMSAATPAAFANGQLYLMESVDVAPNNSRKIGGRIRVTRPFDLDKALTTAAAAGFAGELAIAGQTRTAGAPLTGPGETRPLPSETGAQVRVAGATAAAPAGAGTLPFVVGGGIAAALGLILVLAGMMMKPRAAAAPVPQPAAPDAVTKLTAAVAVGTPSPVDAAGSAVFNPSNLAPGSMIGRWEVVRRLGSGGMADVYLAHSKGEAGFEKLVAIKVMHAHLARNQRAVDHFLDEARLAARIHHPNVVAIQDLGKIGDDYVIVMEYVDGVDLERLLMSAREAQRLVPLDVALTIVCRICDGLHAAHTAVAPDGTALGIIHRDVKSANVLVSRQGTIKVVDFGIAKAAAQSHLTAAGETKGTPSMMAPEQRVGELVDVRADVYSAAAVGYEIVTGHGVNLDLAALAHLGIDNWPHLPPPSSLRANLPPELDGLLLTAMAFERDRRPADCSAFEAQLAAMMKRHGLIASDKDVARWVDGELRQLLPPFEGVGSVLSKPAGAT
jgi:eukaryotic-like serine/threonine-protein kinase